MRALMERVAFKPVLSLQVKPRMALDPDLVVELPLWNLDGNSFLSQDAYGQTCVRNGATPGGQAGWSFDGTDDYVDLGTGASLTFALPISVAAWFYPTSTSGGIVSKWNLTAARGWLLSHNAGTLTWNISADGLIGTIDDLAATNVAADLWHHVVAVHDGVTKSILLDGKLTSQAAGQSAIYQGATVPVYVGVGNTGLGSDFTGRIAEFSLYKRALTEAESLALWHDTKHRYGGG